MPNGVIFNGLSTTKNPTSGDGQLIYTDGSIFIGQIKKGQPHGHGEKIWHQQDQDSFTKTYVGNWILGNMEGFGELSLQEGEVYIGNFKNGYPNGQGIRKWKNGDFYEGNYINGFQTGKGMFLSQEQGWKYDGEWQYGKMTGEGTCQWRDGTLYKGEWKNCIKEGKGQLTYADGSQVIGEFKDD